MFLSEIPKQHIFHHHSNQISKIGLNCLGFYEVAKLHNLIKNEVQKFHLTHNLSKYKNLKFCLPLGGPPSGKQNITYYLL